MKTMRLFAAIAAVLVLLSATAPLSIKMNKFVDRVEKNCGDWTDKEWEESRVQYSKLIGEFKQNYDSFTPEEKNAINRAKGRYYGLYIKYYINGAVGKLQEAGAHIVKLIMWLTQSFILSQKTLQ